ncbi:MAG: hypothetical protein ACRYF3_08460, partial [Janthinobacterium lividum]
MLTPHQVRDSLADMIEATSRSDNDSGSARERSAVWWSALAPDDLVRLDDHARTGWPWNSPPWCKLGVTPDDLLADGVVAALASLHPDGRVRQRAVGVLAGATHPLSTALLALRMVDHVASVRADASTALAARTSLEEAAVVLPVLLVVSGRALGAAALTHYVEHVRARSGGLRVLLGLRDHTDRRTRRWVFTTCLRADLLSVSDLLRAAQDPHDQFIRRTAVDQLAEPVRQVEWSAVRTLLSGHYADGRAAAVAVLPDEEFTDADLTGALVDRSPRVCEAARGRARRRGIDAAAVYRALLDDRDIPSAQVVACLAGLTAVDEGRGLAVVVPYLDDPVPSVRAAAVRAVAVRAEPREVVARIGPLLLDRSPQVTGAAARSLSTVPLWLGQAIEE